MAGPIQPLRFHLCCRNRQPPVDPLRPGQSIEDYIFAFLRSLILDRRRALSIPFLPRSPRTRRSLASTNFPFPPAQTAQMCYSVNMTQTAGPFFDAWNAYHHLWTGRTCRTPRPKHAPPRSILSRSPKVAPQTQKGDICRLADDKCRHKSTIDDPGNVLSRRTDKISCHERKKKFLEKEDIGRHWTTSDTLSIPLEAKSPQAAI